VTWNEVEKMADYRNGYVFYFTSKYCIDAWETKKSVADFANDARGITRVEGLKNNCEYLTEKKRCFIEVDTPITNRAGIPEDLANEIKNEWNSEQFPVRTSQA